MIAEEYQKKMDKDENKPWTFWSKVWITIEALVGLFVIWIACTLFTIVLTWVIMGIRFGECTVVLMEEYWSYIKIGYGTIVAICFSEYLRRLYRKYKIKNEQ